MSDASSIRKLQDRLDSVNMEGIEGWKPRPGDKLVGTVVEYQRGEGMYGPVWICVVEEEGTGNFVAVWLSHHVLKAKFAERKPKPGSKVGIKRLNDKDRKDGKAYARYTLMVDGDDDESVLPDFFDPEPVVVRPAADLSEFADDALSEVLL